jgi:hypothetical protein
MNKNTTILIGAVAIIAIGVGAYVSMSSPSNESWSWFKTQSVNQCPELPWAILWNKNPFFSDGSDLSSLFWTTNEYLLIDVSKTNCAACTSLWNAMNQDSEIQKLLWPESNCWFLSVAATSDLNARKNHIWWFIAANSKWYWSPSWDVRAKLAEFWNKLWLSNLINGVPRYVFMKRDGTFVNESISPSHTTIKNIVQQYCTMCPNTWWANGEECSQNSECESWYCEQTTVSKCVSWQYGEKIACAWFTTEEQCLGFTQPIGPNNSVVSVCEWEEKTTGVCSEVPDPVTSVYCDEDKDGVFAKTSVSTDQNLIPHANLTNNWTYNYCTALYCKQWITCQSNPWTDCDDTNPQIQTCPWTCGDWILDKWEQCDGVWQAQCGKWATCSTTWKTPCTCQYSEVIGPDKIPEGTSDGKAWTKDTTQPTSLPTTRSLTR